MSLLSFLTIIRSWRITKAQNFFLHLNLTEGSKVSPLSHQACGPLFCCDLGSLFMSFWKEFEFSFLSFSFDWIFANIFHSHWSGGKVAVRLSRRIGKFICFVQFLVEMKRFPFIGSKNPLLLLFVCLFSHRTFQGEKRKKKNTNNGYMFIVIPKRRRQSKAEDKFRSSGLFIFQITIRNSF